MGSGRMGLIIGWREGYFWLGWSIGLAESKRGNVSLFHKHGTERIEETVDVM
jgi:hypothetical protein